MNYKQGIALFIFLAGGALSAKVSTAEMKVYVANEDDGTISVIGTRSNSVTNTVDLMKTSSNGMEMFMAHNVQVSPDGKTVWVTAPVMEDEKSESKSSDEVVVIDTVSDKIIKRIAVGRHLHLAHVVLDADSKNAYVTAFDTSEIYKIDAEKYKVSAVYKLSKNSGPHGARICGSNLFAAEMENKALAILDLKTESVIEIPLGGVAVQTACTSDGRFVFVSLYDTKEIIRYDVMSGALLRIPLPQNSQGPVQIYLSEGQKEIYIADQGVLLNRPASNLLFTADIESGEIKAVTKVGLGPHGVALSADEKMIFVTNMMENTVSVVESKTNKVLSTIKVGKKPNGISVGLVK